MGRALRSSFNTEVAESVAYGYLVTYVGDFLILGPGPIIDNVKGVIEARWNITDKPAVACGSGCSVEYLSVHITALDTGCCLDQPVYTNDRLSKWIMDECRFIGRLKDPGDAIHEDGEPSGEDAHTAQRLAGGLRCLATRMFRASPSPRVSSAV